ncbi:MAG: phenylalanine--tRNA ligase beta subunit-related protein [Candidatus Hadarchaeales archaeon]
MWLRIEAGLRDEFPELRALAGRIEGVRVEGSSDELERLKAEVMEEVRRTYRLETVKDHPVFRSYRDFFWRIGIDPTKVRPAAEALIRRILGGKPLPRINTLVDAYNLASIRSCISIGAFDEEHIRGELLMRKARAGEEFLGIGMGAPVSLDGNEIVVSDEEKIIAIYPYRDSEATKVTEETKNVLFLSCGVPGISAEALEGALKLTLEYVKRFCGGREEP